MSRMSTHTFRVRLRARDYRDIEIESTKSLYDLAAAIVQAFDFDFDHAFGFYSKLNENVFDSPVRYELFADLEGGGEARSVKRTTVAQAFPAVGAKMQFLFDHGDDWRFQVEVIGMGYLLIPGIGWGSPTGIDEALDVTTGCLIRARDGPAP
jgi:hypothetical protein